MAIGKGYDKGPQKAKTVARKALQDAREFAKTPEARLVPQGSDLESLLPEEIACGGGGGASRAPAKRYVPVLKDSVPPGLNCDAYGAKTYCSEPEKSRSCGD